MDDLMIRQMTAEDKDVVAKFIYNSFWQKMLPLHSLTEEEALMLIEGIMLGSEFSMSLYYVAELKGEVVGAIKLKKHEDEEEFTITANKVLLKIGVIKLIKAGILLSAMDTKVLKGHLYIELFAVDEAYRNRGIGTKMLEFSVEEAKRAPGINHLSLHVVEKNHLAMKLYERFGFKTLRSQWNSVIKGLGGIRKVYFMDLEI